MSASTVGLGIVVGGLLLALLLVLDGQRRTAKRLLAVGRQIAPDVVATGSGLGEAASVVERAADRVAARSDTTSISEARLATALSSVPQGVVLFDGGREVVFRNRAAAAYLDGRHEVVLVEEAVKDLVAEVVEGRALAPGRELELFGPPARALSVRAIALQESAGGGALVVIEDVTEQRRLEGMRSDFVANISHELKTPVGALGLLAETLVAEDDPALARRLAERMMTEAFRVARTIDDLLELTRIETDEPGRREHLPVNQVVTEAMARVRGAADQRGIHLDGSSVAGDTVVSGDGRQLVSAVYNLLDNAVKYSESGTTVEVGTRAEGDWAEISVTDRGTGIPERDIERVFERFYRVDRARSRETGGTGLGLAIVRHVARNHLGEVRVESREGEGSTFTLRLPLARASGERGDDGGET